MDGGPGAFWQGMVDWVDGTRTIEQVFADIDAEWAALRPSHLAGRAEGRPSGRSEWDLSDGRFPAGSAVRPAPQFNAVTEMGAGGPFR